MLVNAPNDTTASLSRDELEQLQKVIHQYSPLQLAWASGYLAAKSEMPASSASLQPVAQPAGKLTILYGSQTGNAKGVAQQVESLAKERGIQSNLVSMGDYKPKSLKDEGHLVIIASTNGEGEPPDDALVLHEFLASKRAPKLNHLKYSVLALGDSSYEFFCQTGKDFDERLAALGAIAIAPRVDCDVDYQAQATEWQNKSLDLFAELLATNTADIVSLPVENNAGQQTSIYSKDQPFIATILENQKITGRDSNKTVHHIEIDLADSGIQYKVGDALGIWPTNDIKLVTELAKLLNLDLHQSISLGGNLISLESALSESVEITSISKNTLLEWSKLTSKVGLQSIVADNSLLREFLNCNQLIDLVREYPLEISAQEFFNLLPKISPRLYSIASSQAEVDEEVHLTVGLLEFEKNEQRRVGCASSFLIERLKADDEVKVFIEHNNNFRLPANSETAIIMVGPGTGVAPFRAFLQEREAQGASGKNWLFFGDQTFTQDFLYQVEWQGYLKSGLLSNLNVAFSRDQAEKVYVQHKIRQCGKELFSWLEGGAHLYICGDMSHMAKDVHQALVEIVAEYGNKNQEQAEDYLKQLRINKRYQKDVY